LFNTKTNAYEQPIKKEPAQTPGAAPANRKMQNEFRIDFLKPLNQTI